MRTDRRRALWFALAYALAMTGIHAWVQSDTSFVSLADFIAMSSMVLNVLGMAVTWLLQIALASVGDQAVEGSVVQLVLDFLGLFVQGLFYAVLVILMRRLWSASRARAVLYPGALAAIGWFAFNAGLAYFDKVNCSGSDVGDCDLGFIDGIFWAASAIGASFAVMVVVERRLAMRRSAA